ncbi:MAG: hypothetical protein GXP49_17970 [Deltaproteobacteria bacterium]|nr:hypothetical protein [Deltaproteobacteria bacterium]
MGASIGPGVLVFYHNHGDPGPGVYLVERWSNNKAIFSEKGHMVPDEHYAATLEPLPPEGFYRVRKQFYCCEKHCTSFEPGDLVQLGYNGAGQPIIFRPTWSINGVHIPGRGTRIKDDRLELMDRLNIMFEKEKDSEKQDMSDNYTVDPDKLIH